MDTSALPAWHILVWVGAAVLVGSGLAAVTLIRRNQTLGASMLAVVAIWSGIFWCAHVPQPLNWLGLGACACGIYVLWRTAERL